MPSQMIRKKNGSGLTRLFNALRWSLAGLRAALRYEKAFQQEVLLFCVFTPLGIWLGDNGMERSLLIGSLLLVLLIELLNSAIEAVVDRIGEERHPLAGRAKDMGSAAVLLSLINAALIWGFILI